MLLLQRICFSAFKSSHSPCFLTPLLTNPLANSDSLQLFQPNCKSLRLGFQRTISVHSHGIVSQNYTDSTINAPKAPSFVREPHPDSTARAEIFRALEASLGSAFSSQPAIPNPDPLIIVISGPSGVGKDSVIKRLREVRGDMHFVVTVTSRAKRDGEVDGKDYFFRTKDEFLAMIDRDELLEFALVYGDYKGIPKQQIRDFMSKGCDIVLRVDVQGAATLRRILKNSAVFVFLVAESEEALVKRLIGRKTETVEALLMRVASAKEELSHLREFDYVVVNKEGELENSVIVLESIIDAEKAKVHQRRAVI